MFNLFRKKSENYKMLRFYFAKGEYGWDTEHVYSEDTGVKFILSRWLIDDKNYNRIYPVAQPPNTSTKAHLGENKKFVDLLIDIDPVKYQYYSNWLFGIEKSSVKSLNSIIRELVLANIDEARREALKALGVN